MKLLHTPASELAPRAPPPSSSAPEKAPHPASVTNVTPHPRAPLLVAATVTATGHRLGDVRRSHMLMMPRESLASLFGGETHFTPAHCGPTGSRPSPQDASGSSSGLVTNPSVESRGDNEPGHSASSRGRERAAEGGGSLMCPPRLPYRLHPPTPL